MNNPYNVPEDLIGLTAQDLGEWTQTSRSIYRGAAGELRVKAESNSRISGHVTGRVISYRLSAANADAIIATAADAVAAGSDPGEAAIAALADLQLGYDDSPRTLDRGRIVR